MPSSTLPPPPSHGQGARQQHHAIIHATLPLTLLTGEERQECQGAIVHDTTAIVQAGTEQEHPHRRRCHVGGGQNNSAKLLSEPLPPSMSCMRGARQQIEAPSSVPPPLSCEQGAPDGTGGAKQQHQGTIIHAATNGGACVRPDCQVNANNLPVGEHSKTRHVSWSPVETTQNVHVHFGSTVRLVSQSPVETAQNVPVHFGSKVRCTVKTAQNVPVHFGSKVRHISQSLVETAQNVPVHFGGGNVAVHFNKLPQ